MTKFISKTDVTATLNSLVTVTYVLALAAFGGTTKNRNDLIYVALPKVAKAGTIVTVACQCCWHYLAKTLPVKTLLKLKLKL
jgi:hypothetical protein